MAGGEDEGDTLALTVIVETKEAVEAADKVLLRELVGLAVEDTVITEGVLVELPVYDNEGKEVGVDSPVALTLEEKLGNTETVRE